MAEEMFMGQELPMEQEMSMEQEASMTEEKQEARFEDFNFQETHPELGDFRLPDENDDEAPLIGPFDGPSPDADDASISMGELDLGGFEGFESDFSLGHDDEELPMEEPLDKVSEEELITTPKREVEVQGLAEDIPHLDIQRGPRLGVSGVSRLVARDSRRSPLFWVVVAAAVVVGSYTVFNLFIHPEAFSFLNVAKIKSLLLQRKIEADFGIENLKGYYRDMPNNRQVFLIKGVITNKSQKTRGMIRVRANLFNSDGDKVESREVYCGNELTDSELATLPVETIESRLQNQVGEGLSNIDIAPGAKVRFMVVFLPPPSGVAKFNVNVLSADG